MQKLQLTLIAAALILAVQARASWYDLTFTDGVNVGHGEIDVVSDEAIKGTIDVTSGLATGVWTLMPGTGSLPFSYDSAVHPSSTPFLDAAGLLFSMGANHINLCFEGYPSYYSLYGDIPGSKGRLFPESQSIKATLTAIPVPEASTVVAGALMLLPFGVSTLRIVRKKALA